ncbi:MAG TPA: radical SAM protein [Methanothrix sp.]|nr:radical SAM protein [Methanothrix sp.]
MIIRPFDPWKSPLCTCPPKYSLNPYTGCPHGCLYCYASSYIPRFSHCRPKAHLLSGVEGEARRLPPGALVALSSSSDPYPPLEERLGLTRGCLQILGARGLSLQVVTKSHLVAEDADILAEMNACAAITVTSLNEDTSLRLEPGAPPPRLRLAAMSRLAERGIPVSARIDPIIPAINDCEIDDLVFAVCRAGAAHITSSTFKARPGSLSRIASVFPEAATSLQDLFARGERICASLYLPADLRRGLMERVKAAAEREGATFSSCREGTAPPPGIKCDGTHLINAMPAPNSVAGP